MSDRYVFAKVDPDAGPKALHLTKPTDIPAPSPEDWQKVVDAVKNKRSLENIGLLAHAAVRNMREAER